jgi:hypothetical protein
MEANAGELKSIVVHKEEAMVEMIGALEDRLGDWHLTVGCHRQTKKQTQGNGGAWQKLTATQGQLTYHAISALHKGHDHQGPGEDVVVHGTPKGWIFEKIHRV